jgi:hypothetical protein
MSKSKVDDKLKENGFNVYKNQIKLFGLNCVGLGLWLGSIIYDMSQGKPWWAMRSLVFLTFHIGYSIYMYNKMTNR